MIDSVFERAGESFLNVVQQAMAECLNMNHRYVCTEHLLIALSVDKETLAAAALATMKMEDANTRAEVERQFKDQTESELLYTDRPDVVESGFPQPAVAPQLVEHAIGFSDLTVQAMTRAFDYSLFFGQADIEPVHLLLALIDMSHATSTKIFDDMGANLTFLRREILHLMASELSTDRDLPGLRDSMVSGLRELIDRMYGSVRSLDALSSRSGIRMSRLPGRAEIVHRVCVGYFSEFLWAQVAFRRYLLEESMYLFCQHTGPLEQELVASLVTSAAQNMREEVRAAIEYMLSNEYRLFDQMMDEAEYDEIGTVIEDIWWTQGEEIALHELYIEAMDDHRRQQMLGLQKRRIEISQRLAEQKSKLTETVSQCFERRSVTPSVESNES
ncbi:MAG: hypothetical protein K8F91_09195 [Candidatus Obscuribacterales bacterium]|nr:hypothetical protein [Candidatus Obscuribacterales bacterium]